VLPVTAAEVRLFLHIVAATVWVGGQFTLAGLVPTVRTLGEDAPKVVARAFNRIAWPAFAVLVLTGLWNLTEVDVGDRSTEYQVTLFVKLIVVAVSGVSAALHIRATSKVGLAVGGALSALSALGAVFLGVQLHG
jgi:putative copper export protein